MFLYYYIYDIFRLLRNWLINFILLHTRDTIWLCLLFYFCHHINNLLLEYSQHVQMSLELSELPLSWELSCFVATAINIFFIVIYRLGKIFYCRVWIEFQSGENTKLRKLHFIKIHVSVSKRRNYQQAKFQRKWKYVMR